MVHFLRNLEAHVPKTAQQLVAAAVRPIFHQDDRTAAQAQLAQVCATLKERFPKVVALLTEAKGEIFTFYDFPPEHRRQIYSTNPFEMASSQHTICA